MIKKLKQIIVSALTLTLLATPVLAPVAVHAATFDLQGSVCNGTNADIVSDPDASCTEGEDASNEVNHTVELALNLFSAIVGIIAVVMIIVGGIKYVTSGGESSNIQTAKNTIMYAVIGLVVVALAQIIVHFVLERFAGN